ADAFLFIADDLSVRAETDSDTSFLKKSADALTIVKRFNPSADAKKIDEIHNRIAGTFEKIAHAERVRKAKEELAGKVNDFDAFESAYAGLVRSLPELRDHAEVKKLGEQASKKFQEKVVWKPNPRNAPLKVEVEE